MYDLAGSCGANDCLPDEKCPGDEIMMVKEGLIRALNEKVGKEVVKEMIIN